MPVAAWMMCPIAQDQTRERMEDRQVWEVDLDGPPQGTAQQDSVPAPSLVSITFSTRPLALGYSGMWSWV